MTPKGPKFGRKGTGDLSEAVEAFRYYKDASLLKKYFIDLRNSDSLLLEYTKIALTILFLLLSVFFVLKSFTGVVDLPSSSNLKTNQTKQLKLYLHSSASKASHQMYSNQDVYRYVFSPTKKGQYSFKISDAQQTAELTFGTKEQRLLEAGDSLELSNGRAAKDIQVSITSLNPHLIELILLEKNFFWFRIQELKS